MRPWPEANDGPEKALAISKGWVTDEHHCEIARKKLEVVRKHL
jgi:hypothetical protein